MPKRRLELGSLAPVFEHGGWTPKMALKKYRKTMENLWFLALTGFINFWLSITSILNGFIPHVLINWPTNPRNMPLSWGLNSPLNKKNTRMNQGWLNLCLFPCPHNGFRSQILSYLTHTVICAMIKRRYERLQLRSAITTQNMWFTVCSDRGPYVAIPLFRLCLWLKLPVGRMTFQSFDVRVRHWSSRSGLVFLGSCKMACRQVYMR